MDCIAPFPYVFSPINIALLFSENDEATSSAQEAVWELINITIGILLVMSLLFDFIFSVL